MPGSSLDQKASKISPKNDTQPTTSIPIKSVPSRNKLTYQNKSLLTPRKNIARKFELGSAQSEI